MSLLNLPREIIYCIFQYLHKHDVVFSFFEVNHYFALLAEYFVDKQLDLTKVRNEIIFQYCLSTILPSIGPNLRCLSIGYPYCLSTYIHSLEIYCPHLDVLHIHCYSNKEDIRRYAAYLTHPRLLSLTLIHGNETVGKEVSHRLLNERTSKRLKKVFLNASLIFHLSSTNDLSLLKRYSESSYLSNGVYMIECLSTGEWLTDSKDDLCTTSNKLLRECLFSIQQIDSEQCCLEYELWNEQTQRRLTVLICHDDEEHWISSSILSTHRKESNRSCSVFTFEESDRANEFYIRPGYTRAKRLQVSGKRVIVSLCENENSLNHCFRLHHI